MFLGCILLCIFDRRGCFDLFLLLIWGFECGTLFCKIQDGSYLTLNSILTKLLTFQYLHGSYAPSYFITEGY